MKRVWPIVATIAALTAACLATAPANSAAFCTTFLSPLVISIALALAASDGSEKISLPRAVEGVPSLSWFDGPSHTPAAASDTETNKKTSREVVAPEK